MITKIEIETSPYRKSYIAVFFSERTHSLVFKSMARLLQEVVGDDAVEECSSSSYLIMQGSKARNAIDFLFSKNQISAENRSVIEPHIREIESNLDYAARSSASSISMSQKDVMESVLSPYLEHIVSLSIDHEKMLTLFEYTLSTPEDFLRSIRDIRVFLNTFIESDGAIAEILESVQALNRLCWGHGNLEKTFLRLASVVPDLKSQRDFVVDGYLKSINTKFPSLPVDERFCCAMQLIMMSDIRNCGIYPSYTRAFLDKILNGGDRSREVFMAFCYSGGVCSALFRAVKKAAFTQDEMRVLLEIKDSELLRDTIIPALLPHPETQISSSGASVEPVSVPDIVSTGLLNSTTAGYPVEELVPVVEPERADTTCREAIRALRREFSGIFTRVPTGVEALADLLTRPATEDIRQAAADAIDDAFRRTHIFGHSASAIAGYERIRDMLRADGIHPSAGGASPA
jgi:hypothetical protein